MLSELEMVRFRLFTFKLVNDIIYLIIGGRVCDYKLSWKKI